MGRHATGKAVRMAALLLTTAIYDVRAAGATAAGNTVSGIDVRESGSDLIVRWMGSRQCARRIREAAARVKGGRS